jgi:ABC-type sugar transport system permease subunit
MKKDKVMYRWNHHLTPWCFLALPLLVYGVWIAYPIIYSFILSLYDWDGSRAFSSCFAGLANYREMFADESFLCALKNNMIWVLLFLPLPMIIGFILALLLYKETAFNIFLRALFYIPMLLSFAVTAIIWGWVYQPSHGIIAQFMQLFSLPPLRTSFITNPKTGIIAIAIVGVWHWIGFPLTLYLAALKDIPAELYEAARVDGATNFQKIIHITIPMLRSATMIVVSLGFVLSVKVFDLVYLMAGGYYKNEVLSTLVWNFAFNRMRFGMASAVSVIQFIIVLIFVVPYIWKTLKIKEGEV